MATTPDVRDRFASLLGQFHPLTTKNMFGGVGIFSAESGNMFALITAGDELYMKVDDSNRGDYEALNMGQFHRMPYFAMPDFVLDDGAVLREWVLKSAEVAARAPRKKKRKKKK